MQIKNRQKSNKIDFIKWLLEHFGVEGETYKYKKGGMLYEGIVDIKKSFSSMVMVNLK